MNPNHCNNNREVTLACTGELVATTGHSADDGEADTVKGRCGVRELKEEHDS